MLKSPFPYLIQINIQSEGIFNKWLLIIMNVNLEPIANAMAIIKRQLNHIEEIIS
jgi:hypothetical protein